MYLNESKDTANTFFFPTSMPLLPHCFDNTRSLSKFTLANIDYNFQEFDMAWDNEQSKPIKFIFDDLSNLDKQSSAFEDIQNRDEEFADGPSTHETHLMFGEEKHHNTYMHHYACDISPTTLEIPTDEIDIESPYSKNAETYFEAKENTFNSFTSTIESRELDNISEAVNKSETDMNKYVSDLILFWEQDTHSTNDIQVENTLIVTKTGKRRMRKSALQMSILEQEYAANSNWTKEDIRAISSKSGLEHCQVYKWYWDQYRKSGCKPNSW